jgi:hypothetical protein
MSAILDYALLVVLLLAVVHALLPRTPLLRLERGRLSLRPPLHGLLGESIVPILVVFAAAYLFALLLSVRALPGAALVGLVMSWLGLRVWRQWRTASVVFDRSADCIRHGPRQIGRVSQAASVNVAGEGAPALELLLRDTSDTPTLWTVPGVDDVHAPTVGRAIAEYLGVPFVTRAG